MKTNFEALENRNLFSVPAVTDFRADHQSAPVGVPLTLSTTGIAQAGIRAATYWLDLDGNGRWTPGIDSSLGDTWLAGANQQATLSRTVLPTTAWPQNVRLMTNLSEPQVLYVQGSYVHTADRDRATLAPPRTVNVLRVAR